MPKTINNFEDCQRLLAPVEADVFALGNSVYHGLGLLEILPSAKVICLDDDNLLVWLAKEKATIFSLEEKGGRPKNVFRSSANLLAAEPVQAFLKKNSTHPWLYVPKSSRRLEIQAQKIGAEIIGASSALNHLFEDKISFTKKIVEWGLSRAPRQEIEVFRPALFDAARRWGWPLVIQFNRGIAGEGTKFLENQAELASFAAQNEGRPAVVAKFVKGKTITLNACVTYRGTVIGRPFWQITGAATLNRNRGGTGGNDYAADLKLSDSQSAEIAQITQLIGAKMFAAGYRGLFGLDLIVEEKITVIEINARPTASIPTYTQLERESGEIPLLGLHLLEFLRIPYDFDLDRLNQVKAKTDYRGSKVIIRNTTDRPIEITRDLAPGVYELAEDRLVFKRFGRRLKDIRAEGEFLVWTAKARRQINPNIEMAIVYFRQSVLDSQFILRPEIRAIAATIKEQLLK